MTDFACLLQDLAFGKLFTDHMLVVSPSNREWRKACATQGLARFSRKHTAVLAP